MRATGTCRLLGGACANAEAELEDVVVVVVVVDEEAIEACEQRAATMRMGSKRSCLQRGGGAAHIVVSWGFRGWYSTLEAANTQTESK